MSLTEQVGTDLEIESDDGAFAAYLSVPASGRGPGIVVLQEWWGLVPQIRDVCDRLARAGFVALAPDLYRGTSTTDPDEAGRLMMELEIERAGRDLVRAVDALRRRPETEGAKVGVIGFCMGGKLALHTACLCPEIAAVVDCYGVHPNVAPDYSACRAKVFGVFAENDDFISASDVGALTSTLEEAGVDARIKTYLGVQHAFLNEARPEVYDAEAAARAWQEIDNFLSAELR